MKPIHILFISILSGSLGACNPGKGSSESENSKNTSQVSVPIVTELKATHPRLLLSDERLVNLKQRINADTTLSVWYDKTKGDAEEIMSRPLSKYELRDGIRLLWVSSEMVRRMYILAFLNRMEEDKKYLERAWQELEACAAFPDWNPRHFLDVGEMCHAFAIGYDWLYADLSEDQRSIIRKALVIKGFDPYLKGSEAGNSRWIKNTQNWNFVCNGGVGIAALAVGTEEKEIFGKVMPYVMENLPYALESYAPDGAWDEGAGYWQYSPLGDRWNYYPKRAEGQNTLVINPRLEADQLSDAKSGIVSYNSQAKEVFAVTDFTDAYRDHARKVQRGIYLCDDRKTLMIQDEVELKGTGEIWWFMHTKAEITVRNNAQQVILGKNGKKLIASIQSSVPASFSVAEARPLPSSPTDEYWNPPAGMKKLAIHFENIDSLILNVTFKEASGEGQDIVFQRKIMPMNKWGNN